MWEFLIVCIVVTALAALLTAFRYKRTQQFSWLPAIILTAVSGVNAVINYVVADGWSAIGYFFLFVTISLGSFAGCTIMRLKYKRQQAA